MDLVAAINMAQETIKILNAKRTTSNHFWIIWERAVEFAATNNISSALKQPSKSKRQRKPSSRLLNFIVTQTVSQRDTSERVEDPEMHCKTYLYYPILDKVLNEFRLRFDEPKSILLGVSACHPSSPNFLNEDDLNHLADQYSINRESLQAELLIY